MSESEQKSQKQKTIALFSSILLILGVIWEMARYCDGLMIKTDSIEKIQHSQSQELTSLITKVNNNSIKIEEIQRQMNVMQSSIKSNNTNINLILSNMGNYITSSEYAHSMNILHQDHQDVNKEMATDRRYTSDQIAKIYSIIDTRRR
jgi:hypothetical protein